MNLRPSGYEPDELPDCSTPRYLNSKDPVAIGLFSQKDLLEAIEKAERRIIREKKEKEKAKIAKQ